MASKKAEVLKSFDAAGGQLDNIAPPFFRTALYAIFGIVGLAGVGIAVMSMGSDPGGSVVNIGINGVVLAAAAGAFLVDSKMQGEAKEELEKAMKALEDNEFFFDDK